MTVKELKKKLKGQYTDVIILHTKHRRGIPYTQLGKGYNQCRNDRERIQWIDSQEVDDYELYKTGATRCFNIKLKYTGSYDGVSLMIYIKGE